MRFVLQSSGQFLHMVRQVSKQNVVFAPAVTVLSSLLLNKDSVWPRGNKVVNRSAASFWIHVKAFSGSISVA